MPKSRLVHLSTCLALTLSLSYCAPGKGGNDSNGQGGSSSGGATSSGGSSTTSSGGATSSSGGATTSSGGKGSGGATGSGGSSTSTGGTSATGGKASGGSTTASGGVTGSGGMVGSGGSTSASGGDTGSGGAVSTGGVTSTGGTATGGTGPQVDQGGKALAKPGDSTTKSRDYLNLGDMRLLCNRWGSDAQNCTSTQLKMSVNSDSTIGYEFNRGTCDASHGHPDYPEIEFGVAPFGANSSDLTSPAFSSTTLLPIQIKDLKSASVNFDSFNSTYQKPGYYNSNFEFWVTRENPLTSSNPGVYAEIIVFLGWDGVRMGSKGWPCENLGSVTAGNSSYTLCHQKDGWGSGWRFFNFNLNNGPQDNFSGKADVKAMLDWVMGKGGFDTSMWLTRIEVGTEVDDNTQGTAKIKNLTFEINGTSKSIELQK
jgi:hypothetical protein